MDKSEGKNNELKIVFYEFNRKILLIEDFLELSKWSVEDFIQHLSEDRSKKEVIEKYSENFDEWYKESVSFLPEYLYESVFLLAWSCFMELLQEIVVLFEKYKYKKIHIPEYVILLQKIESFGFSLMLSPEIVRILNGMNDLRNKVIHKFEGEDVILKSKILNYDTCEYFLIKIKEIGETLENVVVRDGFTASEVI